MDSVKSDTIELPKFFLVELQQQLHEQKEMIQMLTKELGHVTKSLDLLKGTTTEIQNEQRLTTKVLMEHTNGSCTLIPSETVDPSKAHRVEMVPRPGSISIQQNPNESEPLGKGRFSNDDSPQTPSHLNVPSVPKRVEEFIRRVSEEAPKPTPSPTDDNLPIRSSKRVTLADYEIVSGLGSGAYGLVVLGQDKETNNEHAIKMISLEFEKVARDELKALRRIDHPNVVKCRHGWVDHINRQMLDELKVLIPDLPSNVVIPHDRHTLGVYCLQMELCRRGDLKNYLQTSSYNAEFSRQIFSGIVSGLVYIHSRQMIHRDLKPQNILIDVTPEGNLQAKIGDVGIAKFQRTPDDERQVSLMNQTRGVGTPTYQAPEQANSSKYGRSADIFSLGILLFELSYPLCNQIDGCKAPFGKWLELVKLNLIGKRILPSGHYIQNDTLHNFILKMTEHDPKARPKAPEIHKRFGLFGCHKCSKSIRTTRTRCTNTICPMVDKDICISCFNEGKICKTTHQFDTFEMISFPL